MAKTLLDLLTSLSYRLAEDSVPSDSSEKARRVRFINEGYRNLISRYPFRFTEASTTDDTVASQEAYALPSDFRLPVEIRVDDLLYTPVQLKEVFGIYNNAWPAFNYDTFLSDRHYYIYANEIHLLPIPSSNGTDNISIKYLKYPTEATSDTSTFIIPDFWLDALVAYAYARICMLDDLRGNASDGMTEFEEMYRQMVAEDNRRKFFKQASRPVSPDTLLE